MNEITKLRKLNEHEVTILKAALEDLARRGVRYSGGAESMLDQNMPENFFWATGGAV